MFEAWQSSCIRCSFLPFFSLFFIERSKNIRPFPCSFSVTNSSLLCCCLCVISFSSLFRYINVIVVRGNNRKKDTCSWCYGEQRDRYNMHHAPCCASSLLLNAKMIVTQFQSNSKAPAAAATTAQEMIYTSYAGGLKSYELTENTGKFNNKILWSDQNHKESAYHVIVYEHTSAKERRRKTISWNSFIHRFTTIVPMYACTHEHF